MTTQRLLTYAAVAGGVAWFAKLAVLAATDGAESIGVATCYVLGLSLLSLGSIGLALRLLEWLPRLLSLIGAALAPIAFLAIFSLLDSIFVPLTEEHVPNWAQAEAGVFLTAVIWSAGGTWALAASRRHAARTSQAAA